MTKLAERPMSEVFERYALGLANGDRLPEAAGRGTLRDDLFASVLRAGARGWPEQRTLFTRRLPPGCAPCLEGGGSNLALTTRCTRSCFFCFNPEPRSDAMSVHGRSVEREEEAADILADLGIRSVGLSGGEPLTDPDRALRLARLLRRRLGRDLRIDLYTNGDLFTRELLLELKRAGVDGLRINLAANGYDASPAELALQVFSEVAVEIPAIPAHEKRLRALIGRLDQAGVPHLILHELFCSAQNLEALKRHGCEGKGEDGPPTLAWSPVSESEETVLRLFLHALATTRTLSLYYCSCGTQQMIAQNALARAGQGTS